MFDQLFSSSTDATDPYPITNHGSLPTSASYNFSLSSLLSRHLDFDRGMGEPIPLSALSWWSRIITTPSPAVQLELPGAKRKQPPSQTEFAERTSPSLPKKAKVTTASATLSLQPSGSPTIADSDLDDKGNTALMRAIVRDDIPHAFTLLSLSADPNIQNKEGNTALILAIKQGQSPLVRQLIRHPSINILLKNHQQKNALFYLNMLSSPDNLLRREIEILLTKQLPKELINASREKGTLLCSAVRKRNLKTIEILLQRGADPNLPDADGNTPLMLAVKDNYILGVAELLPVTTHLNHQNDQGNTALLLAIQRGYIFIARKLIEYPLNIFLLNNAQQNAFLLLAQQSDDGSDQQILLAKEMVVAAVQHFPSILNVKVDGHNTLAALAATLGELTALRTLIARGADLTIPDSHGNTPLILAAKHGHVHAVKFLTLFPNKVDPQNLDGDTALMLAIRAGHLLITNILLTNTYRVNIFVMNTQGDTAFSFLLHNRVNYTHEELSLATTMLNWAVNTVSPGQIDWKIDGGNTLLCLAVILINISAIHQLLNKGANLNIPNHQGNTPIMLAIRNKHLEITRLLLKHHPDLSWQNAQGESANTLAAKNGWELPLLL